MTRVFKRKPTLLPVFVTETKVTHFWPEMSCKLEPNHCLQEVGYCDRIIFSVYAISREMIFR